MNALIALDLALAVLEKSPRIFGIIATLREQGELTAEEADAYERKFRQRMQGDHWKTDKQLADEAGSDP